MKIRIDIFYLEIFLNRIQKGDDNLGFPETFKALSDPVRREILVMLKSGKKSAGEISKEFDMTGATISYHISIKKSRFGFRDKIQKFYILRNQCIGI
ncbi:DNA-binding transcriptional ArsR family regulator [Clostridium beijerinckii]|nr:DNA-binding transcriptional ArsR family regulator [Clostridium beijerinckii]